MPKKTRNALPFTRHEVIDLARRAHAIADGSPDDGDDRTQWMRAFRRVREVMGDAKAVADVEIANRFVEIAEGDREFSGPGTGNEPLLSGAQALEFLVNADDCSFKPTEVSPDALCSFAKLVRANMVANEADVDELHAMRPDLMPSELTRLAAAMLDSKVLSGLYHDRLIVRAAGALDLFIDERSPKPPPVENRYRDIYNVHGPTAAVGPGATANDATVQDNRFGGTGTINENTEIEQFLTKLVAEVNSRSDAPEDALPAVVAAKAAARAGDPSKALVALKTGGGWLMNAATQLLTSAYAPQAAEAINRWLGS